MKKLIGSVALVAGLGLGAFALSTVLPASAQSPSSDSSSSSAPAGKPDGPKAKVKSALDGLVANGTITQQQEDAVIDALKGAIGPGGRPGLGKARALLGEAVKTAAGAIGITPDQLKSELQAGKSVADVAAEHNVPLDTVTSALTDAANKAIDQAVTDGKLSPDQAAKIKPHVGDAVTAFENGHKGDLRKDFRKGLRGKGPMGNGSGSSGSDSSSSSSS